MRLIRRTRRRPGLRRRGLTLLEVSLALTIAGIATAVALSGTQEQVKDMKAQIAGAQFSAVAKAAERYLTQNVSDVHLRLQGAGSPYLLDFNGFGGRSTRNGSSIDELVAAGALPASWDTTGPAVTPYRHDYQVWLRYPPNGDSERIRVGFEAMVLSVGADQVDPLDTAAAAQYVGGTAGFVNNSDAPDTVRGLYGSWTANLADYRGAGGDPAHLAFLLPIGADSACGPGLYRTDIPGCPRSNRVNMQRTDPSNPSVTSEGTVVFANSRTVSGREDPANALGIQVPGMGYSLGPGEYRARFGLEDLDLTTAQLNALPRGTLNRLGREMLIEAPDSMGRSALVAEINSLRSDARNDRMLWDGLLLVNSYLELSPPEIRATRPTHQLPATTNGNIFRLAITGNTTIRLPQYLQIDVNGNRADTATSVTVVARVDRGSGIGANAINFQAPGSNINWGYGETSPPDNCTQNNEVMIYQFLRFSRRDGWTGQLAWQGCDP